MHAERCADRGVTVQMAKIRRKPVSSAFYANDFPPIFTPDLMHSQHAESPRSPVSYDLTSESNDSSDTTLHTGERMTNRRGSYTHLLVRYNTTTYYKDGSASSDRVIVKPRSSCQTRSSGDVSDLPTDDSHSSRVAQLVKSGSRKESSDKYQARRLWTPIWLKKRTLVAFVVLYLILLLNVILLWRVSRHRNGFTPQIFTNRYTWTYGPTAVFVIVVGL